MSDTQSDDPQCETFACTGMGEYICASCTEHYCNYCQQVKGSWKKIDKEDYSDDDNMQYFCEGCDEYDEESDDDTTSK